MGLLGNGLADPQSAANMGLAAGLLSGNIGGGFLNGQKLFSDSQQNAVRNQLAQAQIANMNSEMDLRKSQLARQQQLQSLLYGYLSPTSAPSVPAALGQLGSGSVGVVSPPSGMPAIPTMPAPAAGGSRIGSMSPDALALFKMNGLDLTDIYREARPDMQVSGGYAYDRHALKPGSFLPQYSVSQDGKAQLTTIGSDGMPQVSAPRGALDTYGAYRNLDAGIAARNELVQVAAPDGSMRFVPKSVVLNGTQPAAPVVPTSTPATRPVSLPSDSDRFAILSQELQSAQNEGRTGDVAALQREIARLPASARVGTNPSGLAVPGFQATQTTRQKLSAEAGGKINDSWLKSNYEPTVAAGQTAQDLVDTVKVTRQAMDNLGPTGWGTQAKAAAGAVLSGLGIAPKNVQMFTANAEVFQKTAMERLWNTLNAAKGPQTEGDAARAAKTYANLQNRPEANQFILDFAEAKAQRDLMKSRFYQQALPIARDKGDLQEVEREWTKRMPSIFSMPTMQRWSGGIK